MNKIYILYLSLGTGREERPTTTALFRYKEILTERLLKLRTTKQGII